MADDRQTRGFAVPCGDDLPAIVHLLADDSARRHA